MNFKQSKILAILLSVFIIMNLTSAHSQTSSTGLDYSDHTEVLHALLREAEEAYYYGGFSETVIEELGQTGDLRYVAPLLDMGYFLRGRSHHEPILNALEELTGQPLTGGVTNGEAWRNFFTWASSEDIPLPPSYDVYKGRLFGRLIDPRFEAFFQDVQETAQVNMVEAVWGGVLVDGIPSLVNARQISPQTALQEGLDLPQFCDFNDCSYPLNDELVFGVSINGDHRAYPLRLLNWHEMFNDVIGHTPLLDAPNGKFLCNFRAPTEFKAVSRSGGMASGDTASGDWIEIIGQSANCPEHGWLAANAVNWYGEDWTTLPDETETALTIEKGLTGSVKGKAVMLAYCTLCGSGILFDATLPEISYTDNNGDDITEQNAVLEFGSTGMLMRSNKLMYDRKTNTVWNALKGTPAFGQLAGGDIELEVLPVVVTDWSEWLELHPDTSVLSLKTGVDRDYSVGGVYGAYFNSDELMFPVWLTNTEQNENKDMVFATKHMGTPKAYSLEKLIAEPVLNDSFAGLDLVLVSRATPERDFFEPGGASVRAYERSGHIFTASEEDNWLVDETNQRWQVTENALVSESGEQLVRLPGHLAFWFGWYSFNPDTLVYE